MKLLLIRHGATEWSVSGQHTGRTDLPLTELGHRQVAAAARAVQRLYGDELAGVHLFCSPMLRARATAAVVAPGLAATIRDELHEVDYGDFEGLTRAQIQERQPGWALWHDGCPGGETLAEVEERVDAFLASVDVLDGLVIAVAHGHLLRILTARAIGLAAADGRRFTIDTASLSLIADDRGTRALRHWNLTPAALG